MSRLARQYSETGLYHIFFRGQNRQHIFEEDEDYKKMLEILSDLKREMGFELYVYCLMSNHVNFLIKEKETRQISLIMKRLLTKYVRLYNYKYQRTGTLIANRYKSKPIETDEYFLPLIRYVHQNPVRAGLVYDLAKYPWSSYNQYINNDNKMVDTEFVLSMMSPKEFKRFHKETEKEIFVVDDRLKITDEGIRREIKKKYRIEPKQIAEFDKEARNTVLRELKERFSIRQIERVTGISRGAIYKS